MKNLILRISVFLVMSLFFSFNKKIDKHQNKQNIESDRKNKKDLGIRPNCGTTMYAYNNAPASCDLVSVTIRRHLPSPELVDVYTVNYHGGTSGNIFTYFPTGIGPSDGCECDVKVTGVFSSITFYYPAGGNWTVYYNSGNTGGIYLLEDYFQLACNPFTITIN